MLRHSKRLASKALTSAPCAKQRRTTLDPTTPPPRELPASGLHPLPLRTLPGSSGQRALVPPSVWFDHQVASSLWMPAPNALRRVSEGSSCSQPSDRERVLAPLLTSWFGVRNFADEERAEPQWMAQLHDRKIPLEGDLHELGAVADDDGPAVNSVIKLKLYATTDQRAKLDQLFASHRGVYNMAVAQSWRDCLPIFATKKRKKTNARRRHRPRTKKPLTQTKFKSIAALSAQYRGISSSERMPSYFRNKRYLQRHLQVPAEVRDNVFRDFLKSVKASRALYYSLKAKGKLTTFPVLSFKSKFSRSDTIELRPASVRLVDQQTERHDDLADPAKDCHKALVRILPRFFGFQFNCRDGEADEGIKIAKPLPELVLSKSVRLQRLREGDYFLVVPRAKSWEQQYTDRVCALDPGVRQFLTLYDPRGRTLSIDGTNAVLKRRFDAIDGMKSKLDTLVNASKEHHKTKMRTRQKAQAARSARRKKKTAMHRHRYRLRRRIRYTNRRVTRMVHDMHQMITSWLASQYRCVLLPSFQTAEMVRLYEREEAADGTPRTCSDERALPAQTPTESHEEDVDELEMPTTRPRRRKRERVIRSSTARAVLAQAHFKFKQLLRHKLARVGGRLVDCEEEYTSKTCLSCGMVNETLGGDRVFRCSACHSRLDRDVNAARNILIKNREMLAL